MELITFYYDFKRSLTFFPIVHLLVLFGVKITFQNRLKVITDLSARSGRILVKDPAEISYNVYLKPILLLPMTLILFSATAREIITRGAYEDSCY